MAWRKRLKRFRLNLPGLLDLFEQSREVLSYRVIQDGLPKDVQIVNVRLGWPNDIEILLTSAEFPELEYGAPIPEIAPVFQRVNSSPELIIAERRN